MTAVRLQDTIARSRSAGPTDGSCGCRPQGQPVHTLTRLGAPPAALIPVVGQWEEDGWVDFEGREIFEPKDQVLTPDELDGEGEGF